MKAHSEGKVTYNLRSAEELKAQYAKKYSGIFTTK
jgi:hypothetical protein